MRKLSELMLRVISSLEGQEGGKRFLLKVALSHLMKLQPRLFRKAPKPWIRILVYHSIEPYEMSLLASQLRHIAVHYQVTPLSQAIKLWKDSEASASKPQIICIAFDDGFASLVDYVAPIFQELELPATVFITTGFINAGEENDLVTLDAFARRLECSAPPLKWKEIGKLAKMGFEIGAHAVTHRNLASLPSLELEDEITSCKRDIENHIDTHVRYFAYPFGHPFSFNEKVKKVVADAGFEAAFTAVRGNIFNSEDAFELPRNDMKVAWPSHLVDRYLEGHLEAFLHKLYLWRLRLKLVRYPTE